VSENYLAYARIIKSVYARLETMIRGRNAKAQIQVGKMAAASWVAVVARVMQDRDIKNMFVGVPRVGCNDTEKEWSAAD
jgi:hypothetical protein